MIKRIYYGLVTERDCAEDVGIEPTGPIIFEQYLDDGNSIERQIKMAKTCNGKYGKAYLAKIEIIEEIEMEET